MTNQPKDESPGRPKPADAGMRKTTMRAVRSALALVSVGSVLTLVSLGGCKPAPSPDVREAPAPTRDGAGETAPGAGAAKPAATLQPVAAKGAVGNDPGGAGKGTALSPKAGNQLAEFAAGCFWGVEDAFRKVPGVTATAVGYTGGKTQAPTYEQVCDHGTEHAETVLVEFDPAKISYEKLLVVFFAIHDPTTMNRQGPDVGDQYRSAIFTFNEEQAKAARAAIVTDEAKHKRRIVTQVKPIAPFWRAEDYHQQYAERTGSHGCPTGKIPAL